MNHPNNDEKKWILSLVHPQALKQHTMKINYEVYGWENPNLFGVCLSRETVSRIITPSSVIWLIYPLSTYTPPPPTPPSPHFYTYRLLWNCPIIAIDGNKRRTHPTIVQTMKFGDRKRNWFEKHRWRWRASACEVLYSLSRYTYAIRREYSVLHFPNYSDEEHYDTFLGLCVL